jgi:hypothetical protein
MGHLQLALRSSESRLLLIDQAEAIGAPQQFAFSNTTHAIEIL